MQAVVKELQKLNDKYYVLKLSVCDSFRDAVPGQLIMLHPVTESVITDPILRRPFAVSKVESGILNVLFAVVGRGTFLMSKLQKGQKIELSRAFGNGYTILPDRKVAVVVGGVGVAPAVCLVEELKRVSLSVDIFYGGKGAMDIVMVDTFEKICDDLVICTEDGSMGVQGLVTAPFAERVSEYDMVYTCGPSGMMKNVVALCTEASVAVEVSLEERMACGVGACMSCVVDLDGASEKATCCANGPVFDGKRVIWGV